MNFKTKGSVTEWKTNNKGDCCKTFSCRGSIKSPFKTKFWKPKSEECNLDEMICIF